MAEQRAGSLQNLLYDNAINEVAVEVGMGATVVSWTDRHAGTVIEVNASGSRIVVQEDTATRTDGNGMSDSQSYTFERNENGRTWVATRRKDGSYRLVGGKTRVLLGHRDKYFDFCF